MMRILGVTPARGGSKTIPRKNLKDFCGKPLIAWTIEAAQDSQILDDFLVSTEDPEITKTAESLGARVLSRPASLAGDEVLTLPVLQHIVEEDPADILVLLQATSPIRDGGLIDRCIERFLETDADSLATGFICKHAEYGKLDSRRQDMDGVFADDGNVYVIRADLLRRGERYGNKIERMILDQEQNVEIDCEFDFWHAEQIMKRRQENS